MKQTPIRKVSTKKAQQKRLEDKVRSELLERCEGHCMDCGGWPDWRGLALHHKIFLSHGGTTDLDNCALLCGTCHEAIHLHK